LVSTPGLINQPQTKNKRPHLGGFLLHVKNYQQFHFVTQCAREWEREKSPQSLFVTLNYFLFFTFSGWLIFETLQPVESAQIIANTYDEFATFTDSYFKEDVDSFDEPYTLIKL